LMGGGDRMAGPFEGPVDFASRRVTALLAAGR
jgi:hypothetical protein